MENKRPLTNVALPHFAEVTKVFKFVESDDGDESEKGKWEELAKGVVRFAKMTTGKTRLQLQDKSKSGTGFKLNMMIQDKTPLQLVNDRHVQVHTDKNFVGGRISTGSFLLRFKCENHTTRFVACFKTAQQANCAVSPKTKKRRTTNDAKKTEGFEIVGMAAQINLAPPTFLPAATPGKPTKAAAKAAAAAPEIAAIAPLAAEPVVVEKLVTDPALVAKVAALGESLATVEERNVELTEEVAAKKESIDAMQIVLTSMQKREHELVARETTLTEAHEAASLSSAEATSTNASLAMQVEASAAKLAEATAAATAATASMATMQAELNAVQAELMELRAKMTELAELEASNAALQTAKAALVAKESVDAAQIAALMEQLAAAQADVAAEKATNAAQAAFVAGAEEQVNAIKGRALAAEKARTKIHDELMEVRGNIRVFCRMRPAAASAAAFDEDAAEFLFPDDCVDEIDEISDMAHCGRNMVLIQKSKDSQGKTLTKENEFAFDGILGPACDQETAFNCAPAAMIQSALDGKNACIFAYGQTGSGKTHTMTGTTEAPGVIPRALQFLFNGCDLLATRGWSHTVSMQMVEIYNESLVDLLHEEGAAPCAISVRHLPNYTEVAGARSVDVANAAEAMSMLALADVNRTVGQTDCNAHSSRSHSVCIVRIRGMRGERSRWSTLNLVDLAGSERLSKSGAGRDATLLKETQAINKSLSTLGNVMSCLLEKGRAHIPFRNSKLTYLLQKSLQDKSKVLMIACLSPQPEHAPETKCTLHFATKVNKVTMS